MSEQAIYPGRSPINPGESIEPFVGIEQAAAFLAVKVSWLYEQVRLDKVPSYKIGAFRRFRLGELSAWAKTQGNGAWTS